jgi:hypothetical protein
MENEDILNKLNVKFDRFGNYNQYEQQHIIQLLKIAFDDDEHDYDPSLYDKTYVITFYYDDYLVGCICAMDNYDMQQNMTDFIKRRESMHIDYEKKGCFVYNLAVLKVMRKRKLGSSLVKMMCYYLKGLTDYFHVQIRDGNKGSERIFEKNGFMKSKTLSNGEFDFNIFIKNNKK